MLSFLSTLAYLNVTTTKRDKYYSSHLRDEETTTN